MTSSVYCINLQSDLKNFSLFMKWNEGRVMSSTASKVLVEKYLIKNTDLTMKVGTLGKIYVTFTFILNPGKYSHCKKGGGGGGGGIFLFSVLDRKSEYKHED